MTLDEFEEFYNRDRRNYELGLEISKKQFSEDFFKRREQQHESGQLRIKVSLDRDLFFLLPKLIKLAKAVDQYIAQEDNRSWAKMLEAKSEVFGNDT